MKKPKKKSQRQKPQKKQKATSYLLNDKDALKVAIGNEIKGRKLYLSFSKKTKIEAVKKLFTYLADQELVHIEVIKKFQSNINADINYIEVKNHFEKMGIKAQSEFFNHTVAHFNKKVKPSTTDLNAREIAMEIEHSSYDYYKKCYEKTIKESLKKFFKYLMEQESGHYMLIRNMYDFLQDPHQFYASEEKWNFEG